MHDPLALSIEGIEVGFEDKAVVRNFSIGLPAGEIGCLLGPSGCGKTTVLRAIAGFARLRRGQIALANNVVSSATEHLPPEQRGVGMVFQDYALFPHLDVAGNVAFGLSARDRQTRTQRVQDMLEWVGLQECANRFPHQLSGGQQQRVALARALAPSPRLLLLDEPFSNLDLALREKLATEVKRILKQTGTPALFVTHDQHEAFALADRVGVMSAGQIIQWASPYDLYHQPATRFVAEFIGEGVLLQGLQIDQHEIVTELGVIRHPAPVRSHHRGPMALLIRPDDIQHDDASPLQARVVSKAFRGAQFLYTLALPSGQQVLSLVPSHHNHAIGEPIGIRLEVDHVVSFEEPGAAL
jgi:iron(III) transport system ATP-binding protein